MKALALIPARSGSKGIPGKNSKLLAGKPLIAYTIEAALEVFDKSNICLSTDDENIIRLAEDYGLEVPFVRPAELATDTSSSYSVINHALKYYEDIGVQYDILVYLQPTSPLRNGTHIKEALDLFHQSKGLEMVVSVKETSSNPYYVLFEEDINGFLQKSKEGNFIRRQDCPRVYEYNGAIYIVRIDAYKSIGNFSFNKRIKYIMNELESLDLDTKLDWLLAEKIIELRDEF